MAAGYLGKQETWQARQSPLKAVVICAVHVSLLYFRVGAALELRAAVFTWRTVGFDISIDITGRPVAVRN